jgi:hypothetical protein
MEPNEQPEDYPDDGSTSGSLTDDEPSEDENEGLDPEEVARFRAWHAAMANDPGVPRDFEAAMLRALGMMGRGDADEEVEVDEYVFP